MKIKSGINLTKLVTALMLMCSMFGFNAMAQTNPNKSLNAEGVAALIEELTDGLPDLIEYEEVIDAITEKWEAREDLAGKTRAQILKLLFADVKSTVKEQETQNKIWKSWAGEEKSEDKAPAETPQNRAPMREKKQEVGLMKLYVGNLAFQTSSDDLQQLFSQAGEVVSAEVVEDKDTGRSRGFGFVVMSSREEGSAAINKFNGYDIGGRALTVSEARPREQEPK
jgi:cold-inducible RNA-binding protein